MKAYKIANKEFTTLADLDRMMELCQGQQKAPASMNAAAQDKEVAWVIKTQIVVARGEGARGQAEKALGEYLAGKHRPIRDRDPDEVAIAEILKFYAERRGPAVARPEVIGYAMTPTSARPRSGGRHCQSTHATQV